MKTLLIISILFSMIMSCGSSSKIAQTETENKSTTYTNEKTETDAPVESDASETFTLTQQEEADDEVIPEQANTTQVSEETPELLTDVSVDEDLQLALLDYAKSVEGQTIDRGECWDFVAFALDHGKAQWERPKGFGPKIAWNEGAELAAGDVILLEKASLVSPDKKNSSYFYKHYGMIYEVQEGTKFKMVHQNYNDNRTVHYTDLDISHLQKGSVTIYRPGRG